MTTPARSAAKKTTAAPKRTTTTTTGAASSVNEVKQQSLQQHLANVADGEVLNPADLYTWLESLRALTTGIGFFVAAGASQLEAAARKGARDSADGRMTMQQKVELVRSIRKMHRELERNGVNGLLDAAKSAVRAWSVMQDFLDNLESDAVDRPHRGGRGGFDLSKGR